MYLGLDPKVALSCFNYDYYGPQVVEAGRKVPEILRSDEHVLVEGLIGEKDTTCFSMTRYTVSGGEATLDTPASIWVCAEGEGVICSEGRQQPLRQGDYFFLPAAAAGKCSVRSEKEVKIVCCAGGK